MSKCIECGRELTFDEAALYRRLYKREISDFKCIKCMAAYFNVTEELLYKKIEEFKEMGCTLFFENQE